MMFMAVGVDDAIGREARCAAMRMVNDDDVLDPEEVLRDGDRPQGVDRATAGDDDREKGRR